MSDPSELTGAQKFWAAAGFLPFLLSLSLLGHALADQALLAFAIAWPLVQIVGYTVTLRKAGGDPSHPLVRSQVILHWLVVILIVSMLFAKA